MLDTTLECSDTADLLRLARGVEAALGRLFGRASYAPLPRDDGSVVLHWSAGLLCHESYSLEVRDGEAVVYDDFRHVPLLREDSVASALRLFIVTVEALS